MTKDPHESLSALLDGECRGRERERALDRLLTSEEARGRWERYCLVGQAMRHEPIESGVRHVAGRVRDALAPDGVLSSPHLQRPPTVRIIAPLASALAAGLVLVAIFAAPFGPTPDLTTQRGPGQAALALAPAQRWHQADPTVRARLDQLVVDHHERMPAAGLSGFVSYVAVVGPEGRP
ncbi:MAG: sigma-E factor negative regulatory protein [Thiohalocapsa sp.]|jgi:negative regulator of sigma E activity